MFKKRRPTNSGPPGSNYGPSGSKKQRVVDGAKVLLDIANESSDWFPPLKSALGGVNALIKHYEQFEDVKGKIQELLPQLDRFKQNINTATTDGDPEETNRREQLAGAFRQIKEESQKLLAKNALTRFADKAQDSSIVARLVERLREAIVSYQISQQQAIYSQITHLTSSFDTLLKLQEKPPVVRDKLESVLAQLNRLRDSLWQRLQHERWTQLINDLKPIRDKAKELHGRVATEGYVEDERDITAVSGLTEDLRDVLLEYWMAQQQAICDQNRRLIDEADLSVLNNCRRAQGAEYRHGNRRGCLKGTRKTVLDEIESWVNDFDKSPVFWLNGLAGTGKSTIAQTIAERVFAQDCLGASFFCSRDFEDRSDLKFIFPTLAFQLAHKYPDFRSHFVSLLKSNPDVVHESLYSQMQQLIAEPLQETGVSTVIVIDALDECKDDEPSSVILSVLGRFVEQIPGVKFFITGRPEPRIETGFRLPLLVDSTDVFVLHNVHPSLINSDIRLFLKHELSELSRRRRLGGWPSDEHIDVLCRRAAELFVYAVATVKFLDSKTHLPRDRLDVILKLPDSTAPEGKTWFNPKTTLDSLYMSILRAAFDKEDPDVDSKVRTIIGTIVLLVNPLPPLEIAELMGLKSEEVILFLTLVQSLFAMGEDYNQPVKPFHKSFPDFITDSSRCDDPRFYVSPEPLHLELTINCLRVMNEGLGQNLLSLPEYALNSEVEDLQTRIDDRIDIALRYACRSWHNHLTEIEEGVTDVLADLSGFLRESFLAWLEVLSVLGDVGGAVVGLEKLMPWLEKHEEGSQLLYIVQDHFRVVTKFFEPISASATHIYHSALELSPMSSIVRSQYYDRCNRIAHFPRVVVGTPDKWSPTMLISSKGHEYKSCTWSPCGRFVAAQTGNFIEIRNQLTFELLTVLQPPETTHRLPGSPAYSPDGRSLACTSDSSIIIWDIQTGGVAKELNCGTNITSLEWSLDGRSICTICDGEGAFSIYTHNIVAGTTLSLGKLHLQSGDRSHLWAHGPFFRVITIARSHLVGTIEVFEVGCALTKKNSFHPTWDAPTSHSEITLSSSTSRVSVYANLVLRVFGNWNSDCLLREEGLFFSQSFSPDGSLFGSFKGSFVHVWKENSGRYSLWKKLQCPDWSNPSLHFSPVLSSILGRSKNVLQVWRLNDLPVNSATLYRDRGGKMVVGISRSGNHVAIAKKLGTTVKVVDSRSGAPSQSIDIDVGVDALALTGNVLLVVILGKIVAWLLTDEGLVVGVPGGMIAGLENSIWTIPISDLAADVVLRVGSHVGVVEIGKSSSFVYHTETGEFLPHESIPQHFSGSWNLLRYSLRGRDHLHCHSPPQFNTPPEGDWQASQVTLQEGWIKDPEGRHRLWIPVEWRTSWDRADWLHDIRTQFSIIGDKPVIVRF